MKRRFWGIFTTKAQPFSKWWQEFRSEVTVIPMEDPFDPVVSVDDKVLTVRTGYHNRRNYYIVPWMLMLSFMVAFLIHDLWPDFNELEQYAVKTLANIQEDRRTGSIPMYNADRVEQYMRTLLNDDGKVTFDSYIKAQELSGELDHFFSNIGMLCFFLICSVIVWLVFLLKPRDAEVYFDRQQENSGHTPKENYTKGELRTHTKRTK